MNSLLHARERRSKLIDQRIKDTQIQIIAIKTNLPGPDKHLKEAYLLTALFAHEIASKISVRSMDYLFDADGPFVLLDIPRRDPNALKAHLMLVEENHPLGRLIDLDLYDGAESLSRTAFSKPPRTCFLCKQDARICSRNQTHPLPELLDFITIKTHDFIREDVSHVIRASMLRELTLDPKFGLVTPMCYGSHPDMPYPVMLKAMDAIIPFFAEMFSLSLSLSDPETLFRRSQLIGMLAEEKMLEATSGINCYKGLIFVLGLSIIGFGHALTQRIEAKDIACLIQQMTKDLSYAYHHEKTFGAEAYLKYGIRGARGEAMDGLPHVFKAIEEWSNLTSSDADLRHLLKSIIIDLDDTVLLKRAQSITFYHEVKKMIAQVDVRDEYQAKAFTQFAIENHLSFGGSADVMISALVLDILIRKYMPQAFIAYK